MSALTAPYDPRRKEGELTAYPVAANTKCFKGGLAALAGGYAQPAADAAGVTFAGVFAESADNGSGDVQPGFIEPSLGSPPANLPSGLAQGAAGAVGVRVYKTGAYVFGLAGATQASVGQAAYVVDDNNVSTAATTHNVLAGYVVEWVDAAHVRVRIDRGAQ